MRDPVTGEYKDDTIVLTLKREPWELTVGGECESIPVAMAMLQEALRSFEMQWRLGYAQEQQTIAKKNAEDMARVQNLLNRNVPGGKRN